MSTNHAEQTSEFVVESFKDGEPSDGSPTATEAAAAAANAAREAASAAAEGGEQEAEEGAEGGEDEGGEEGGEDQGDEEKPQGEAKDSEEKPSTGRRRSLEAKQAAGSALSQEERLELANIRSADTKVPKKDRIAELTVLRRHAERQTDNERGRADRLQAELDALKSGKTPLTSQDDTATSGGSAPDPSQFDYGELDPKYIAALARHETAQALKAHKAEDDKTRQADAAAATQREQGTKQDTLVKAGVKLHDDFDEVVMQGARDGKWDLSQHLGELLLDSEFGAPIAYDLAKDPDEAARVAKLSPAEQAKYLGRQEAKFEAAKSPQSTKSTKAPQAPPPPKTPRGNSGSNKVGADTLDFAALEQAWRAGELR
jgi:hypothetical protein